MTRSDYIRIHCDLICLQVEAREASAVRAHNAARQATSEALNAYYARWLARRQAHTLSEMSHETDNDNQEHTVLLPGHTNHKTAQKA